MLSYLLDEQMSYVVAEQVRAKRPDLPIASLYRWRGGAFLATDDSLILQAAGEEALTLVSYDLSTITPVLVEWGQAGRSHAGVLFIDERSIASNDFGGLVRALLFHWDAHHAADWTDRVDYLKPAP